MYYKLLCVVALCCLISAKLCAAQQAATLHILTYNLNNLYDASNDVGGQDDTYLPLQLKHDNKLLAKCSRIESQFYMRLCQKLDWTDSHYRNKLSNLGVLLNRHLHHQQQDYLIGCLQEVEHKTVARDILTEVAAATQFKGLHIDVPIQQTHNKKSSGTILFTMSNLQQLLPTQVINVPIPWSAQKSFRPLLLNYYLLPPQQILRVVCVHLPSQANHIIYRKLMLRTIFALLDKSGGFIIPTVVLGDFNISSQEIIDSNLLPRSLDDWQNEWYQQGSASYWSVHNMGCHTCRGTYYFNRQWSWLDSALVSWDLLVPHAHHALRLQKIDLLNQSNVIATPSVFPRRYSLSSKLGLSDHFALWLQFTTQ